MAKLRARKAARRVDPADISDALGATHDGGPLHPISSPLLLALRRQLAGALKSSGGRPGLQGADRRQKIPMADADWAKLEQIARAIQADGVHATAGQVAAQLLHEAIARVAGNVPYAEAQTSGGVSLTVAERRRRGGPPEPLVQSANLTVELRAGGRDEAAPTVQVAYGRRHQSWRVHSIVLRTEA